MNRILISSTAGFNLIRGRDRWVCARAVVCAALLVAGFVLAMSIASHGPNVGKSAGAGFAFPTDFNQEVGNG
jgi:hypothetical protein